MKRFPKCTGIYIVILLSSAQLYSQNPKPAFDIRAWVLLDYNMPYLRNMLTLAAEEGINHVQLCHRIGMQLSDYLEPERNRDIRELIKKAHTYGIKVYVWTHELDHVPDNLFKKGKVAADGEEFWEWMSGRYRTLLDTIPEVDGVVVTLTETKVPIDDDNLVISTLSPTERFIKMSQSIYNVLKSHNKQLILRTFTWIEEDYEWMTEAFRHLPDDIIIMSKVNWGDWFQYYPSNPFIGAVSPHPQIIEYDLAGQYHGDCQVPWVCDKFLQKEIQYGLSKNAKGIIGRTEWGGHTYGSANEFNAVSFASMAKDPFIDPDSLWLKWASEKYSPEAAPYVVSALKRTNDIANLTFFTLSFKLFHNSSTLDRLSYMDGTRIMHARFCRNVQSRWKPGLIPIADDILNPTLETMQKSIDEKEKAIELIDASLNDLQKAKPYLTGESYVYLSTLFERERLIAQSWRWINEAYFRYLFLRQGDKSQRESLEYALTKILEYSDKAEVLIGNNNIILLPVRMRNLVADIRALTEPPVKWIGVTNLESTRKPLIIDMNSDGINEIIVNARDNAIHAFRPGGKEVWKHETFGLRVWYPGISDPVSVDINNDGLFEFMMGSADGGLYAFKNNGDLLWMYKTDNAIVAAPSVIKNRNNENIIICASLDGFLYGLGEDGTLQWKIKHDGKINKNMVTYKNKIILGTNNGNIKAFSAEGKEIWNYNLKALITGGLALHKADRRDLISVGAGGKLILINVDGKKVDELTLHAPDENIIVTSTDSKVLENRVFFTGTDKGTVCAIDREGNDVMKIKPGKEIRTPVISTEGNEYKIFFVGVDNRVVAFNPDGEIIWTYSGSHDGLIGSELVLNEKEKEIIFTASDRKLYVLDISGILK